MLTATNFGDLCFFGFLQLEDDEERYVAAMPDRRLDDILQRWRIYQAHSFLAVALQSFLVACVRLLRDHRGGVADDALMAALNASAIAGRFHDIAGVDLPGAFLDLTPRSTLAACNIHPTNGQNMALDRPQLEDPFSERRLKTLLLKGKSARSRNCARCNLVFSSRIAALRFDR